jgi:hypothetical protein
VQYHGPHVHKPLRVTPPFAGPNSILPQSDQERLGKPLSYGAPSEPSPVLNLQSRIDIGYFMDYNLE